MRLQPPDQLSTVLIWVSAIFMAIKGGVEAWPAATRALPQMSAGWLSFVPLVLLLFASLRSLAVKQDTATVTPIASPAAPEENGAPASGTLPDAVFEEYAALLLADATELRKRRALQIYEGKWLNVRHFTLVSLSVSSDNIRAQFRYIVDRKRSDPIWVYFDKMWEDHLTHIKNGEIIQFCGKIHLGQSGDPEFIDARPI